MEAVRTTGAAPNPAMQPTLLRCARVRLMATVGPQDMDLEALENIDDFVGGVASFLGSHTLPSTNLPKANSSYALW